jgi:hypothetical protein
MTSSVLEEQRRQIVGSPRLSLPDRPEPIYSERDLLTQYLDEVEEEGEGKGGVCRYVPTTSPSSI